VSAVTAAPVLDDPALRDREGVFADRAEAGAALADLLATRPFAAPALVLAIPAGGAPVAGPLAARLGVPLDVACVSKITLPWNTEAGYGAVAFDGTCRLNDALVARLGLDPATVAEGRAATAAKVRRRVAELRGARPFPTLRGRTAVLVDDGLASGFTMRVAVEAVRAHDPAEVVVAAPTGCARTVAALAAEGSVDAICCPNVRGGPVFAVASAYRRWRDVPEAEVRAALGPLAPAPS